jgi:hypothetical protein
MVDKEEARAEPTDPESEACLEQLVKLVKWELSARIAIGDDPHTPEGQRVLSELVADTVLDHFVLRQRTAPRYRLPGSQ